MSTQKILVIGASGTGTTTISALLSNTLGIPHIDLDDLFWVKTDPPFTRFREKKALLALMKTEVYALDDWVISGDPTRWGVEIERHINKVVFLTAPTETRVQRLHQRVEERHGAALLQSGAMHQVHKGFIAWTKKYDQGGVTGRTRESQEAFLAKLSCPVIRIETSAEPQVFITELLFKLSQDS